MFLKNLLKWPGFFSKGRTLSVPPVVLVIMDGWGIAPPSPGNVIAQIKLDHLDFYQKNYPHTELIASGESVGLPANEVGNTEVGHLTIGTGRVTYQGLKRINMAIEDGSFLRNEAFQTAIRHAKKHNSNIHILGLLSSGNVHASLTHFYSVLEVCQRAGFFGRVFVHAFTDGRDAPPQEARQLLEEIENKMNQMKIGTLATLCGRYYAMDRDQRWERIEKAYNAIVSGQGILTDNWKKSLEDYYQKNGTDELLEPHIITKNDKPVATLQDNDAVIFSNFRIDRPRELTMALTIPNFEEMDQAAYGFTRAESASNSAVTFTPTFTRQTKRQNLCMVTMTNYQEQLPVQDVAFNTIPITHSLGSVLADQSKKQLHMAESEKQRFVTYYFNGFREDVFPGEDVHIVASPKVATYNQKPEMSVAQLVQQFRKHLMRDIYDFTVINIANPDMVAHTGHIPATIKACLATDKAVGQIVDTVLACGGTVFLTADHGNAEELITYPTTTFFFTTSQGSVNTDHSNNPVPLIVINERLRGHAVELERGSLSDIAPTILTYMGLPVPTQMTGKDLLRKLHDQLALQAQW